MSTIELKSHLHELVDEIAEFPVLQDMIQLLTTGRKIVSRDWFNQLHEPTRQDVMESMLQADNGQTATYESVIREISAKFPQLHLL